jgi:urease accessory protein
VQRAFKVRRAGEWNPGEAVDRVVLDADERQRRRSVLIGERGTQFLLDLPRVTKLRDGDALVLEDGAMVGVVGRPECLLEIAATDPHHLARIAWHLGNRHADVQVSGERLRIRRDHVLAAMLQSLGASVTEVEAPFDPEQGAYGGDGNGHGDHRHRHDRGHGHGE